MVLVYLARKASSVTFNKAMIMNSYIPTTHEGLVLSSYGGSIDSQKPFSITNSLIFKGINDPFHSLAPSKSLFNPEAVVVESTTAGHHLPFSSDDKYNKFKKFLEGS
jgi:hypothetical protein